MRRVVFVCAMLVSCTDWEKYSTDYDGPGVCVTYVVAGDTHTCVRKNNGGLACWGDNRFGQLGTGDLAKRTRPTRVDVGGVGVSRVYVPTGEGEIGNDFGANTCVITTDNAYWCWGDNRFGQLGLGSNESKSAPTQLGVLGTTAAKAALGAGHNCVEDAQGALFCWGRNQYGELGDGTHDQQLAPKKIDLPGITIDKLQAGGGFTCARNADGALYCWGDNQLGQLGIGSNDAQSKPTPVTALGTRVDRLSTGARHTCAFTRDQKVYCWGDNRAGQLGVGDTNPRTSPAEVAGLGAVLQVVTGGHHSCAVTNDGALYCWGDNRTGQLGTGDTNQRLKPERIAPDTLGNGVSIAYAGAQHTCALLTTGAVYCWGSNEFGQLGVDVGSVATSPAQVFEACQ
jgi:alpha-tubulin suppressor-like RCC1 family protein